jgi:site-specific recombinase
VGGLVVVGPINLGVSFYLAFRLALKAQAISNVNRERISAALRLRWRKDPLSFLLPPRTTAATPDDLLTHPAPTTLHLERPMPHG